MDNAEAIKRIKDHIRVHHIGEYPHIKIAEALNMAISALANDNNVGCKWIPASEPPKEWKDENGDAINYMIYSPGIGVDIGNWIQPVKAWFCLGVPFKVTHWMPLPEPPKEDAK